MNSQVKDVQDILEPLRQEVNLLRKSLLTPKKEEPQAKKEPVKNAQDVEPSAKDIRPKGRGSDIEQRLANIKNYKKGIEGQNAALKEKIEELSAPWNRKKQRFPRLKNENLGFKEYLAKAGRDQEDLRQKLSLNLNDAQALRKQLSLQGGAGKSDQRSE